MKTMKKASGFFIVEILIVLVIVGILVLALLPNLQTYVQRAKFVDNINAAASLKPAVALCVLNNDMGVCDGGSHGIPADVGAGGYGNGGYVNTLDVANGRITATSTGVFGPAGDTPFTYILEPALTNGVITWTASGTCEGQGLC